MNKKIFSQRTTYQYKVQIHLVVLYQDIPLISLKIEFSTMDENVSARTLYWACSARMYNNPSGLRGFYVRSTGWAAGGVYGVYWVLLDSLHYVPELIL